MASAVLHLQYLPQISWFVNYVKYEPILIERQENFVKSTMRNRCQIAGANGRQTLTIPLVGGRDHHRKYADTQIAYTANWHDNHWHSIKSAYGSAPYFEFYAHIFQKFYEKQYLLLFDFNLELLNSVIAALKLSKGYDLTHEYQKDMPGVIDLRSSQTTIATTGPLPRYYQVFEERHGFIPDLSILDLIFNLGPQAKDYLGKCHML